MNYFTMLLKILSKKINKKHMSIFGIVLAIIMGGLLSVSLLGVISPIQTDATLTTHTNQLVRSIQTDDNEAPVIHDIYFDVASVTFSGRAKLYINVTDIGSAGFSWGWAQVNDSNNYKSYSVYFEYNESNELWYGFFYVDNQYMPNGTYYVEFIAVQDYNGNERYYNANQTTNTFYTYNKTLGYDVDTAIPIPTIEVLGTTPDVEDPMLLNLYFGDTAILYPTNASVMLFANVTDEGISGINYVEAKVVGPLNYVSNYLIFEYETNIGLWKANFTINPYWENGTYTIEEVNIYDNAGNDVMYFANVTNYYAYIFNKTANADELVTTNFPVATINVQGTTPDHAPPTLFNAYFAESELNINTTAHFYVNITDIGAAGIASVSAEIYDPYDNPVDILDFDSYMSGSNWTLLVANFTLKNQYGANGLYYVKYIWITDYADNWAYYTASDNSSYYEYTDNFVNTTQTTFLAATITVTGNTPDFDRPVLYSIWLDQTNVTLYQTVHIYLNATDVGVAGLSNVYVEINYVWDRSYYTSASFTFNTTTGLWETSIYWDDIALENKTLFIAFIYLGDNAGNAREYYVIENSPFYYTTDENYNQVETTIPVIYITINPQPPSSSSSTSVTSFPPESTETTTTPTQSSTSTTTNVPPPVVTSFADPIVIFMSLAVSTTIIMFHKKKRT